jgi:RNA polymerase sigma-70 factor (ECF subfamily)
MDHKALKIQFTKAYEAHSDAIFRYCLWKTSNRETALDITQETFMRLWDTLLKDPKVDHDKALVFTIARRLVIDHYRKKKTESLDASHGTDEDPFDAPDEKSLGVAELSSEARLVKEKIQKLEPDYRQAVYLRYVEELKPKEIADILGITPNLVSVRINRGLEILKQMIDPGPTE